MVNNVKVRMYDLLMRVAHWPLAADEFSLTRLRIDLTKVLSNLVCDVIHMKDNRHTKG
jgi:hypothetical protein